MNNIAPPQPPDRSKTIEEIEGIAWPAPRFCSYVATTCAALRQKPLGALTLEEMRLGLEQHVGVECLVPLALEQLKTDPLVEVRLYRGDLLESLLNVPASFWQEHTSMRNETARLADVAMESASGCSDSWREEFSRRCERRVTGFRESLHPELGYVQEMAGYLRVVRRNTYTVRRRRCGLDGVIHAGATATSFFPSRPLGTYRDGGALFAQPLPIRQQPPNCV